MPDILSISSSAISTYQRVLGVVSNNIANVGNESYVKQEGEVNQTPPTFDGRSYLGTGALFQGVRRQYNAFIEGTLRNATSNVAAQDSLVNYAERVMNVLGSGELGLSPALDRFFSSARAVAGDPASNVMRSGLLREADGLAARFRDLHGQLTQLEAETRTGIDNAITQVNSIAEQLGKINTELSKQQSLIRQPPALLDQRDKLVRDLSGLIDVRTEESENGMIRITVGGAGSSGLLVDGLKALPLKAAYDQGSAARVDLTLDPYGTESRNVSGVVGGQFGGFVRFRQQVLEPAMSQLDWLANTLAEEVNRIHTSGVDAKGRQGEALFAIEPSFQYARIGSGQPLQVDTKVADVAEFKGSPVTLTFDARAGKVYGVSLLGPFAEGDRIEVSLNGRSSVMTVEGDTSLSAVTRRLQAFIDSDSNGSNSDEAGFGIQLRTSIGPTGEISVSSPVLKDYSFSVRVSSESARAQVEVAQGLWIAEDPNTGVRVSGANSLMVGGLSVNIKGVATDGEQLTITASSRPAGALVARITDPAKVAAADAFRGTRDVDNLSNVKASVVDELATRFLEYPAPVAGQKGGIANNPVASEALAWDASLQIPVGVIPAGQRDVVYYLDPEGSFSDLQILTRDGRHIAGSSLAERAETFQQVRIDLQPQSGPEIGSDLNIADGYVDFSARGEAGETLSFQSLATPSTVAGALSIVGGSLYRGDGVSASVIGTVDPVFNGVGGQPLRINFPSAFDNADFNGGVAGSGSISGWTAINERVVLGGLSTIGGWPTPLDVNLPIGRGGVVSPGESTSLSAGTVFSSTLVDVGTPDGSGLSVELKSSSMTIDGFSTAHGPALISDKAVVLQAGDTVSLDWRAEGGDDNFDVYGYLLNTTTGATTTLIKASGASTPWTTATVSAPVAGTYKFVFISGTHDWSGGRAAGSRLLIDNIDVQATPALSASDVQTLKGLVNYSNLFTTTIEVNGQTITSDPSTSTLGAAISLQTKLQQQIALGELQGLSVNRQGDDVILTSTDSSVDFSVGALTSSSPETATLSGTTLKLNDPGQDDTGSEFVSSHPIFNPGSTYSDTKINTLGEAGYRTIETFYGVMARPLEIRPNGPDHLAQGLTKIDARAVADFPPAERGVNIPAGAFKLNGTAMTGFTGVGAQAVAQWITANAGSTGITAEVENGVVVMRRPADNGDGQIRLSFDQTKGGSPKALASLGFRTAAYIFGEVPEDLAVFASGTGPVRVAAEWNDQPWSVGERREAQRATPFEVRFSTAGHYTIVDLNTGDILAERDYIAGQEIEHAGLRIRLSDPPAAGDTYKVDGNRDGLGDNASAMRLAELEKAKIADPDKTLTLSESYLGLVDSMANVTLQSQTSLQALEVMKQQAEEDRAAVSGVSLDEEAANLIRFQQAYQAAAKSMQVASQMFDAVLRI